MKYRWTTCPQCGCELAINYTESKKEADETFAKGTAKGVDAILV